jgi:hypothetical protein
MDRGTSWAVGAGECQCCVVHAGGVSDPRSGDGRGAPVTVLGGDRAATAAVRPLLVP